MNNSSDEYLDKIAIVGMVCRFPGAKNTQEYWDNLCNGVDSVVSFTEEELKLSGVPKEIYQRSNYVNAKGYVDQVDMFDAEFFDINPREAVLLDPQHRVYLECANEALENAGYDPEKFTGRIAVYSGVDANTYMINNLLTNEEAKNSAGELEHMLSDKDYISSRVSYKLNLKGPSFAVQCACSSSMTAVHLAVEGLLSGESDMALAGGISLSFPLKAGYFHEDGGIVSPHGKCRAFDADADGTIYGNGVGIVVLKRLEDAVEDGDTIHAVILATAVNNDGAVKVGFTAPGIESQASAISEAIQLSRVGFDNIGYIETHGTGTKLGDAIELTALEKAFKGKTDKKGYCAIGSVKTNIGHLSTAAGVASLIKTALILENKKIPPSLHYHKPNPTIDFDNSPFFVNTKLRDWESNGKKRVAGVSSFGLGGTNVHAVLEEPPVLSKEKDEITDEVILLSAKNKDALSDMEQNLIGYLEKQDKEEIHDIAYTLCVGRKEYAYRKSYVASTRESLIEELKKGQTTAPGNAGKNGRQAVYVFSGFGEQYQSMAKELYDGNRTFKNAMDRCFTALQNRIKKNYKEIWLIAGEEDLARPVIAYPLLFTVEYALSELLKNYKILPSAMIGHSIGEYVCACVSGVMSPEDAVYVVYERGRFIETLPEGAMLTVMLEQEEIASHLIKGTSLAAVNSFNICGVSGEASKVEELKNKLLDAQVACISVDCKYAFHSSMMEQIQDEFLQVLKEIKLNSPTIPFISNITGDWVGAEVSTPEYWVEHLKSAVHFYEGIQTIAKRDGNVYVEVGPGKILGSFIKQILGRCDDAQRVTYTLRARKDKEQDCARFLDAVGQMWSCGLAVNFNVLYDGKDNRRIQIPTYPFQKKRYFVEGGKKAKKVGGIFYQAWKQELCSDKCDHAVNPESAVMVIGSDVQQLAAMQESLKEEGKYCVTILTSTQYNQISNDQFEIVLRHVDDYITVFQQVMGSMHYVEQLVILPGVETEGTAQIETFVQLIKAVSCIDRNLRVHITLVTENKAGILGNEESNSEILMPELTKTVSKEFPNITFEIIDTDGILTNKVLYQVLGKKKENEITGIRGMLTWMKEYSELPANIIEKLKDRKNETYLVINGAEGTARKICESLTASNQSSMIYVNSEHINDKDMKDVDGIIHFMQEETPQVLMEDVECETLASISENAKEQIGKLNKLVQTIKEKNKQAFVLSICPYSKETLPSGKFTGVIQCAAQIEMIRKIENSNWYVVNIPMEHIGTGEFTAEEERIAGYLLKIADLPSQFSYYLLPVHPDSLMESSETLETEISYERPELETDYVAPRNELDEQIAEIWHQILGFSNIGIHDSLFMLGGNSLLALQIVFRINKEIHVEVAMADFIKNPTIEYLSDYVASVLWLNGNQNEDVEAESDGERQEFEI